METEAAPVETEVSTPVHDEYVVVLASHVARANAEDFVKRLHQKGYTEARVVERNHAVCVFYGSYDTHDAAYQAASQMHSDKELEQAWVLKIEG